MKFKIRLAGKNILIHSVYPYVFYECWNYLEENAEPDIEIRIDDRQIKKEYEFINHFGKTDYNLQTVESFLIQKIIAEAMQNYDTFLMHGAVVAVDNKSYMFVAPSGTGKTTHIKKWLRNIKGSFVVNGDKPLIIVDEGKAFACGTPWNGKEHMGNNAIVSLHSIVFLERSDTNHIEEVSFKSVFPLLLEQTYQPHSDNAIKKRLELLLKLKDCVRFYRFSINNFKEDALSVSFDALVKSEEDDES